MISQNEENFQRKYYKDSKIELDKQNEENFSKRKYYKDLKIELDKQNDENDYNLNKFTLFKMIYI